MKSAFVVIGVCLVLATAMAVQQFRAFKTDLIATQDLTLGLLYFLEANGRMPASEQEFRASPFVQAEPGHLHIVAPEGTRFAKAQGYPIADLAPFQIGWGQDLAQLKPDEYGRLTDPEHRTVELLRWPSSGDSGKSYSIALYGEWLKLRDEAPAPASGPAHPPGG